LLQIDCGLIARFLSSGSQDALYNKNNDMRSVSRESSAFTQGLSLLPRAIPAIAPSSSTSSTSSSSSRHVHEVLMHVDLVNCKEEDTNKKSNGMQLPSKMMYRASAPPVNECLSELYVPLVSTASPSMADHFLSIACRGTKTLVHECLGAKVYFAHHVSGQPVVVFCPSTHLSNLCFAALWDDSRKISALSYEGTLEVVASIAGS